MQEEHMKAEARKQDLDNEPSQQDTPVEMATPPLKEESLKTVSSNTAQEKYKPQSQPVLLGHVSSPLEPLPVTPADSKQEAKEEAKPEVKPEPVQQADTKPSDAIPPSPSEAAAPAESAAKEQPAPVENTMAAAPETSAPAPQQDEVRTPKRGVDIISSDQ